MRIAVTVPGDLLARVGRPPTPVLHRRAAGLMVTAVLAGLAYGCAQQAAEVPLMSFRQSLGDGTTLRLPNTAPPALVDAGLSSGDGTPIISFYSLNQPIVSVCQAPAAECRRLLPTAEVIPRADSETGVTVLIEAQETGSQMTLSDAVRRYWSSVGLVAGQPAWLASP